jgi:hypothetical protein
MVFVCFVPPSDCVCSDTDLPSFRKRVPVAHLKSALNADFNRLLGKESFLAFADNNSKKIGARSESNYNLAFFIATACATSAATHAF